MKKISLLLALSVFLVGICGCSKNSTENYFGGDGEIRLENGIVKDDSNIYLHLGGSMKKYNTKTDTFSICCDDPECTHYQDVVTCKANRQYCFFNGNLIRTFNEATTLNDGTIFNQGYLYLCGDSEKQVYKNELPENVDKNGYDNGIGSVNALGDDYLVLFNRVYLYILDTDFKIKYTVFDIGSYGGGVYYVNNEIYYIDNLYRLQKLNMEIGEPSLVDLGEMKITEGVVINNVLWFSNGEMALCSYDFETGGVKEHAEKAVRLTSVGKYLEFLEYDTGNVCLYDIETAEVQTREALDINDDLFCIDGKYYRYSNSTNEIIQYDEDYSSVIDTLVLSE